MMDMAQIQQAYPEFLRDEKVQLLREYLQYEILQLISRSKYGDRYIFLGGTCLRIVYQSERFSEDLDFDNKDLTQEDFEATAATVKRGLELLGYTVTVKFTYRGAFHCAIRFPGILFDYELSGHKEARLLIKLDTEKQHYDYRPKLVRIRNMGVDADIFAVPESLLCAQKIAAVLGRKRPKGRDFYDLSYLLPTHKPDIGYLRQYFDIDSPDALRRRVGEHTARFDFDALARDVEPFLFHGKDAEAVADFPQFWETVDLG